MFWLDANVVCFVLYLSNNLLILLLLFFFRSLLPLASQKFLSTTKQQRCQNKAPLRNSDTWRWSAAELQDNNNNRCRGKANSDSCQSTGGLRSFMGLVDNLHDYIVSFKHPTESCTAIKIVICIFHTANKVTLVI